MPQAHPDSHDSRHTFDGPASTALSGLERVQVEPRDSMQQDESRAGLGVCKSDCEDKQSVAGTGTHLAQDSRRHH